MELNDILGVALRGGASDIHIKAGLPPMFRVDGTLVPLKDAPRLPPEEVQRMAFSIMNTSQKEAFKADYEIDLAYGVPGLGRFRVNVFQQRGTMGIVLRVIPIKVLTLAQLNLPKILEKIAMENRGLVLVTGTTGSGKSTTLAAMIDHINTYRTCHIITIEDPIEFLIRDKRSIINQREVGVDTKTFSRALRSAMREDPDVVLVGEMRDLETIDAAITAAETGHLVFGTLHTTGAAKTIDRVVNAFPSNQQEQIRIQLSTVMQAVISQLLIPRIDKPGRVAIFEIMVNTPSIAALIRDNKTFRIQSDIQTGAKYGMVTLDSFLVDKYLAGMISREEVVTKAQDPVTIQAKLQELELAAAVGADAAAVVEGKM